MSSLFCQECKNKVTVAEYEFSLEKYLIPLCRKCQKNKRVTSATPLQKKLFLALLDKGAPAKLNLFDKYKHIDIAIPEARVNIEVDGPHHNTSSRQALSDLYRTMHSFRDGYLTLRVPNSVLEKHFEETVKCIIDFVNEANNK